MIFIFQQDAQKGNNCVGHGVKRCEREIIIIIHIFLSFLSPDRMHNRRRHASVLYKEYCDCENHSREPLQLSASVFPGEWADGTFFSPLGFTNKGPTQQRRTAVQQLGRWEAGKLVCAALNQHQGGRRLPALHVPKRDGPPATQGGISQTGPQETQKNWEKDERIRDKNLWENPAVVPFYLHSRHADWWWSAGIRESLPGIEALLQLHNGVRRRNGSFSGALGKITGGLDDWFDQERLLLTGMYDRCLMLVIIDRWSRDLSRLLKDVLEVCWRFNEESKIFFKIIYLFGALWKDFKMLSWSNKTHNKILLGRPCTEDWILSEILSY